MHYDSAISKAGLEWSECNKHPSSHAPCSHWSACVDLYSILYIRYRQSYNVLRETTSETAITTAALPALELYLYAKCAYHSNVNIACIVTAFASEL